MTSHFEKLINQNLINDAPKHLNNNIQYEVIMGSIAYGVSNDSSDMDVYGFSIPPKEIIFPHLRGEILGFDEYEIKFNQYQRHHILDKSAMNGAGRVIPPLLVASKNRKLHMPPNSCPSGLAEEFDGISR